MLLAFTILMVTRGDVPAADRGQPRRHREDGEDSFVARKNNHTSRAAEFSTLETVCKGSWLLPAVAAGGQQRGRGWQRRWVNAIAGEIRPAERLAGWLRGWLEVHTPARRTPPVPHQHHHHHPPSPHTPSSTLEGSTHRCSQSSREQGRDAGPE